MSRQAQGCARPASTARPLRRALSTPLMGVPGLRSMTFNPAKTKGKALKLEDEVIPERWMFVVVRREKITQAVGRIVQVHNVASMPGNGRRPHNDLTEGLNGKA